MEVEVEGICVVSMFDKTAPAVTFAPGIGVA